MRHHDLVSEGFLALTAAGFVLLCSGLLVFALRAEPVARETVGAPPSFALPAFCGPPNWPIPFVRLDPLGPTLLT